MRFKSLVPIATALVVAVTPPAARAADGQDVGVYGNAWERYVLEHPNDFDFFIFQARTQRAAADEIPGKVKAFADAGVSVVLDMQFFEDTLQRGMREGAPPMKDMAHYEGLFASVLDNVPRDAVRLITIEEENVHWGGRAEFLADLYRALKADYPHFSFYQWYSPRRKPSIAIPGKTWPALPADGWVVDQYAIFGEDFDTYIGEMKRVGKPLLGVVWAVPQWRVADKARKLDTEWWDEKGWKMFYSQVATYRKYDTPIALYASAPRGERSDGSVALYESENACDKKFFAALLARTLPVVRSDKDIGLGIPRARPAWIPGHCG
jgi:hypothetical protein